MHVSRQPHFLSNFDGIKMGIAKPNNAAKGAKTNILEIYKQPALYIFETKSSKARRRWLTAFLSADAVLPKLLPVSYEKNIGS